MYYLSVECPTPGDVPTEEGNLPNDTTRTASSDTPMSSSGDDSSANLLLFSNRNNHLQESLHSSAYQTKIANNDTNSGTTNTTTNTTTPTKSHVLRSSSRKLLHRCSLANCCRTNRSGQHSRSGHRNSGSSNSTPLNIPFVEKQVETTTTTTTTHPYCHEVPDPTRVSGAVPAGWCPNNNYYYYRHSNISSENNGELRWQTNMHNHNNVINNDVNNRREFLARGVQTPLLSSDPHHLHFLQQQQLQTLSVQPYYRKRAINYMMTHLQLRGSENDAAIEAVRKRIERLEDQVFNLATSKDQYVHLLSVKLGLIMESLYNCRNTRINRPQNHAPTTHPQPACV